MFRSYKYFTFYFLFTVLFTSCYNSQKEQGTYFHYNEISGIASLDPAFAKNQSIMWPVHQLFNTLTEIDQHLILKPSLAKRWGISDDRKTIEVVIMIYFAGIMRTQPA